MAERAKCEFLKIAKPGQVPQAVCRQYGLEIMMRKGVPYNENCPLVKEGFRDQHCDIVQAAPKHKDSFQPPNRNI